MNTLELEKLLIDYNKQYPKDESPMSFLAMFGIVEIHEFLKKRDGKRIGVIYKNASDDGAELVYI
tara:strand:+ start:3195 stop:3389 length:195 start_codon:yes stop_codon:yes gene_type:complete